MPEINDTIRYVQPFLHASVAAKLGPWSGYNVLAQHPELSKHIVLSFKI